MSSLTTFQKKLIIVFTGAMILDFIITTYGIYHHPGFVEANHIFRFFSTSPQIFTTVVGLSKLLVIIGIITLTTWFNLREIPSTHEFRGGDYICIASAIGMITMLTTIIALNVQ